MKKILAMLLVALLALSCTAALAEKVGVSMPTKDLQRWNQDGTYMEQLLTEAGYEVELQYASNDVPTQLNQVETMIDNDCQVIVIAAIDGSSLGSALDLASCLAGMSSSARVHPVPWNLFCFSKDGLTVGLYIFQIFGKIAGKLRTFGRDCIQLRLSINSGNSLRESHEKQHLNKVPVGILFGVAGQHLVDVFRREPH